MSAAFVSAELFGGTDFGGAGGDVSVTKPTGLVAGDTWLIAAFVDNDPLSGDGISMPSPWQAASAALHNTYFSGLDSQQYPTMRCFAKPADGTETSVNVTFSSGSYGSWAISVRISGTHATSPMGNVATLQTDTSNATTITPNAPDVTIQANGSVAISVIVYHPTAGKASDNAFSAPSGMTIGLSKVTPDGTYPQFALAYESVNAGSFAPGTWTANSSASARSRAVLQTIEIRVAAAAVVTTGSQFRGRRNMPGRGPYSRGRYFRPRLEYRGSPGLSYTLVVADATHGHAVDAVSLSQANTLTVSDAGHGHTVDAVALIQAHVLAIQDALHAHAADAVALTQAGTLAVDDATHGHTVDAVALVQANVLAMQDALHAHAAESPTLSQATSLTLADASHAHTVDALDLTQANTLAVADATHGHAADSVALVQAHVLAVADALHGHAAEAPTLSIGDTLAPADATHAHAVDSVELTQANVLVVQETSHGHSVEAVSLTQGYILAVADALHAHAAEAVELSSGALLVVADALHGHTADSPVLTQASALIVSDALHAHLADALDLRMPHEPGDIVLFVVSAGDRMLVVAPSQRLYTVQ